MSGKGTHAAVDRLQTFTRAHTRHSDAESAQGMLNLARILLTGNQALNADYRGNPAHLKRVPAHKQLVHAAPEKGLPIGNLTSQFFPNVYLNELDQFVKHTLKVNHYVRYVDDFVLLHQEPAVLDAWRSAMANFLRERLGLSLRDAGHPRLGHILAPLADAGLKRVDRPGIFTSLASQWSYFRASYPHHVLLMQVGNRWECQGPNGLPPTWAVCVAQVPALKRLLTRRCQPWCEVGENGYLKGGKKQRQLVALWPVLPVASEFIQGNLS
jgi:hypothetical protein